MKSKLSKGSRVLLLVAAAALVVVLYTPIWRIDLDAPQYPEGLRLTIHANGLKGNVDIINGLNHYIGMKTLHNDDFIEFTVLPYIIIFFVAASILTTLVSKRKWLYTLFVLFVCFGVIAMIDFWRWEYDYGHNLNPDAAIIVPGMAYQPPLIGFKQLLNFGAYSVPDIGGWLFIGVGAILLLLVIFEWRAFKKNKTQISQIANKPVIAILMFMFLAGCNTKPEALMIGKDNCSFCKMTLSDNRFGAEIITLKGKIYKFDDSHCLLSFIQSKTVEKKSIASIFLADFSSPHVLIKADTAFLLRCDFLSGPMNGNIAAFGNNDSMKKIGDRYKCGSVAWAQLNP